MLDLLQLALLLLDELRLGRSRVDLLQQLPAHVQDLLQLLGALQLDVLVLEAVIP